MGFMGYVGIRQDLVTEPFHRNRLPFMCTRPLRRQAAVPQLTGARGAAGGPVGARVRPSTASHSVLCLPSSHQSDQSRCHTSGKCKDKGLASPYDSPSSDGTRGPRSSTSFSLSSEGGALWARLPLTTSLPSSPVHASLPSRYPVRCPLSPEESSGTRVRLARKPSGVTI